MLEILLVALAIAIIGWYLLVRPMSYWKRLGVEQSSPLIIFGNSLPSLLRKLSLSEFVYKHYNAHPNKRYAGIYQFNIPSLMIRDPELIKQITVKDFEHFTDHRSFIDPDADPLWSNALLNLKGERWKQMRNTLSPTFTSAKIKSISILMLDTATNFVNHFLEKEDEIIDIEIKDSFSRFTNDIIATTAFGIEVNSLKDKTNIFHEMGIKLTSFRGFSSAIKFFLRLAFPKITKLVDLPFLDKEASKYFYEVIDDTIKAREEQNIVRPDMIQLMLEARKDNKGQTEEFSDGKFKEAIKITNAELTSQAMIFFFAGFETVSTAMCFGSYELALNKEIQDRLRKEINETQKDGEVGYDELMQMKYMDMVVSETLRKWPPFPNVDRICTKPYTIEPVDKNEKPVPILPNQQIWIPSYAIQRDPKYFPNPEKFDPERFSEENKHNIVPYTFLSFGVGPRICIGNRFALLEIKALWFNLLLNYEIVPTKKTPIPLVLSKDFNPIPVDGLWLGLKRIRT